MQYLNFNEIAWEDRTNSIKIMLFLNGIGNHDKSKILVNFFDQSTNVEVNDFNGCTYRFNRELFSKIQPSKSKFTLSTNRINLILEKDKHETWSSFEKKKDAKIPKMNDKDPQSGLMDMMKQMYNDGDDEMKKTIAKAWTEAQEKKLDDMN
ncbi:SGS domain protein [Entamoeba marina]